MKKIILISGLGLISLLSAKDNYSMNCNDIKEILPNVKETKLLIQYNHNIICKSILENEYSCLVFKYSLDYKKHSFNIINDIKEKKSKIKYDDFIGDVDYSD